MSFWESLAINIFSHLAIQILGPQAKWHLVPLYLRGSRHLQNSSTHIKTIQMDKQHYRLDENYFYFYFGVNCPSSFRKLIAWLLTVTTLTIIISRHTNTAMSLFFLLRFPPTLSYQLLPLPPYPKLSALTTCKPNSDI